MPPVSTELLPLGLAGLAGTAVAAPRDLSSRLQARRSSTRGMRLLVRPLSAVHSLHESAQLQPAAQRRAVLMASCTFARAKARHGHLPSTQSVFSLQLLPQDMGSASSLGEDYMAAMRYAFLPIVAALTVLATQVRAACMQCACGACAHCMCTLHT